MEGASDCGIISQEPAQWLKTASDVKLKIAMEIKERA